MKNSYVVGAIIVENKRILCAKRGSEKSLANYWEFPGGKIERDETPRDALKRELKEELLIKVSVDEHPYEHTIYEYDFGIIHLTTYICKLESGTPVLTEHEEVRWLLPEELETLEWAPADIPAVKKLKKLGV